MQYEAETHDTPARELPSSTAGVGTTDQPVPVADAMTSAVITGIAKAPAIETASNAKHRRRPGPVTREPWYWGVGTYVAGAGAWSLLYAVSGSWPVLSVRSPSSHTAVRRRRRGRAWHPVAAAAGRARETLEHHGSRSESS